jgi:putative ABC transport system permease protein
MTTRQVRRTVVVEAGILGIVGAILGIVTGLVAAGLLIVLAGGGPLILDPPWASIAIAAVLGVGIAMVAAWYPAILASRLAIVAAVQHE